MLQVCALMQGMQAHKLLLVTSSVPLISFCSLPATLYRCSSVSAASMLSYVAMSSDVYVCAASPHHHTSVIPIVPG